MNTVSKVIITTIVVIVIVAGGWWLIASMLNTNESTNGGTTNNQTTEPSADQEITATITYSGTEFTPLSVTVQAGDAIEVVNESSNVMYFASDEHPLHRDNAELNVGDIQPGGSATFVVSTAGTWGYHDHYNASAGGEIIVE